MNVPMDLAIYDDGPIDAAIGRATNPSMGLTALQVSGAMRCFSRMIFSEAGSHFTGSCVTGPMIDAAGHDRERRARAAAIA
jgi:hypothetical protein